MSFLEKAASANAFGWSDLVLLDIQWLEDGRDFQLLFEEPVEEGNACGFRSIRFAWASELKISVDLPPGRGGALLTFEALFRARERGGIRFTCDFGSCGAIDVVCNDLLISKLSRDTATRAGHAASDTGDVSARARSRTR